MFVPLSPSHLIPSHVHYLWQTLGFQALRGKVVECVRLPALKTKPISLCHLWLVTLLACWDPLHSSTSVRKEVALNCWSLAACLLAAEAVEQTIVVLSLVVFAFLPTKCLT